jgi:uncharacterized membrane protein
LILALNTLKRLDGWILQNRLRASYLLAALIATYFILWCGVSFLRHYYFHSSYDLAIMDQVVWNTAQGRLFVRSIEVSNDLGDHIRLYLALLSPIYWVSPSPYVLLAFQSLVLGLSGWPLYRLASRKFDSPTVGLGAALCFLAYPPLGFLNRYDFHSEVVCIPLLIAAYERIDANDLKKASLFMGLALLAKENIGLTVAALGSVAYLYHQRRRFGLAWTLVGTVYSLIALFVVIPEFRGGPSDTLIRYQWLGDTPLQILRTLLLEPDLTIGKIFARDHVLTLFQLLAPFAFLPLLALPALLPAVPTLIYNFLAEWPSQATIYNHYMAPVIPFMAIASVLGLHRLTKHFRAPEILRPISVDRLRSHRMIGLGLSVMAVATLASWNYASPIGRKVLLPSGVSPAKSQVSLVMPNDSAIREGLKHVPDDVFLLTTANYAPHLSHRSLIEMIPRAPVSELERGVEVIFVNLRDLRWWSCDDYRQSLRAAVRLGFGVVFYRDGVLSVQKGKGDFTKLKGLLDDWPGCT